MNNLRNYRFVFVLTVLPIFTMVPSDCWATLYVAALTEAQRDELLNRLRRICADFEFTYEQVDEGYYRIVKGNRKQLTSFQFVYDPAKGNWQLDRSHSIDSNLTPRGCELISSIIDHQKVVSIGILPPQYGNR